jgi:hypothetical protein
MCFYHTDGDGLCAGAIVGNHFNWDIEMRPINYGHEFPFDEIDKDTEVFMVDFSLEPFSEMEKLYEKAGSLIWIDHHDSVFPDAKKFEAELGVFIGGIRDVTKAACELTWRYFQIPDEYGGRTEPPTVVQMLADYDMWKHDDPCVLKFQYGFRLADHMEPNDKESHSTWDQLLFPKSEEAKDMERAIFTFGAAVLQYVEEQNAKASRSIAFETEIDGIPVIAANAGGVNSYFFDAVLDRFPEAVAVMPFVFKKGRWEVKLLSIKGREHPHFGNIAKRFGEDSNFGGGGGGRAGAAGFQWHSTSQYLPFLMPVSPRKV